MGVSWEGKSFWWSVGTTASERIFSCNHQRTPGFSKSRSLFVKRLEITKKRRTMAVLADIASIHLVLPGADIRTAAMLARGKTTVDLMRLEPKV